MTKAELEEVYSGYVEATDWRYSAAIFGLLKYLDRYKLGYFLTNHGVYYHTEDVQEERYLEFVEGYYGDDLHHVFVEFMLKRNMTFSDEQKALINEKLIGNNVMKKTFGKLKFDGTNQEEILKIINDNRLLLIKETYKNKSNMYRNFANTNLLFSAKKDICRLNGYYIDAGKKGKSVAYHFNTKTLDGQDETLFDFIPFGFTKGEREFFFINDNFTIESLQRTNRYLEQRLINEADDGSSTPNTRTVFLSSMIESSEFLDYDVEVIYKGRDQGFYETMFIRKKSIEILKSLKDTNYKAFCTTWRIKDEYINVQKIVLDSILNMVLLDPLIEQLIKANMGHGLVTILVNINFLIKKGDEHMKKSMKGAFACAKIAAERLPDNKLSSYRQKLTSAVVFKDADRACDILVQMSNYVDVSFDFAFDVFEDFEANKELVYTFINALRKNNDKKRDD